MKFNKLVRDKILDRIRNEGRTPLFHVADDVEYWTKLKEKLQEEVAEFLEAESVEEMADVMEVLLAIRTFKEIDAAELDRVQVEKADARGGFGGRIILEEA